jgi:sortase A
MLLQMPRRILRQVLFSTAARRLERVMWMVAVVCAGYCLHMYERSRSGVDQSLAIVHATSVKRDARADEVVGRMEIPALHLSVPVLADAENSSLEAGVGHIRTTAGFGGLGTVGLAGHRDTFLRPLRNIRPKTEILLADSTGTYRYLVDSTEIVMPNDTRVLEAGERPELVIVTCYPFYYLGSAPKRFIVHAHLVSLVPE